MDFLNARVPPPLVLVLITVLMWLASRLMPFATTQWLWGLGLVVCLGGFGLAFTGLRTFLGQGTTPSPTKIEQAKTLVTSGPYRFTRNPMYLGMVIFLVGVSAILGSAWLLLGPLAFALYITRFQIGPEERMMQQKFGADFSAYRSKVRRWL